MNSDAFTFSYDGRDVTPLELLPQIYQPIYDFRTLANNYGAELKDLYSCLKLVLDSQFIEDAPEKVIAKWEGYLDIVPNGTDTLDERRFRVLARVGDVPPYTDKYLENKLNQMCGEGYWRIYRDYNNYALIVEISMDSSANTKTLFELIRDIIPANMNLTVQEYRTRHHELAGYTHEQLAQFTHDEIKFSQATGASE